MGNVFHKDIGLCNIVDNINDYISVKPSWIMMQLVKPKKWRKTNLEPDVGLLR